MKKYDVFISYRREGGYETAKHLFDLLIRDGYSVSFDIDTLRNGKFDEALLTRIKECQDFIVILNKGVFNRTINPFCKKNNDWLRMELSEAIRLKKNIIPVILPGFKSFPFLLPSDIKDIRLYNGPIYNKNYFDEFYDDLKRYFVSTQKEITEGNSIDINIAYRNAFEIGILIAGRILNKAWGHNPENDDIKKKCENLRIDYNEILDKEKEPDPNVLCGILGIKYGRVCEDVLDFGYNFFLFSYMKISDPKENMIEKHNIMLQEKLSKLISLMRKIAIPQHFINQLYKLNTVDVCVDFRETLKIYFENRNNCIKQCPNCGSFIALDYKECPFCKSIF